MTSAHHDPGPEPDERERILDARLAAVTSALAARSVDPLTVSVTGNPVTARLMREWLDLYAERTAYTARRLGPGQRSPLS